MPSVTPEPGNDDYADLAAFWFARMNSGKAVDPQDETEFRRWLSEDADNAMAYRGCQQAWRLLEVVD